MPPRRARVVVSLNTGVEVTFPPKLAQGLADADPGDLATIEITPSGLGLHWPQLDADLYVLGLLAGTFGSKKWMVAQFGATCGSVRSKAKIRAARAPTATLADAPESIPPIINSSFITSPGDLRAEVAS